MKDPDRYLAKEIGLLFLDSMSVLGEPSSYARSCISMVRSHDAKESSDGLYWAVRLRVLVELRQKLWNVLELNSVD